MKDYKKILEGVVNIINATEKSDIGFANICTYIGENCPELKESNDERMKDVAIEFVKQNNSFNYRLGISKEKVVAWLEAQGEYANFRNAIQVGDKVTRNRDGVLVNLSQLNRVAKKQGEQKHDTDFSDLRTWKYIVDAVLTEKESIGQYLDSPFTEEVAKKLQKRFGNIEQKSNELPNGEDYGIDGLYHAIHILEETFGKVDGYQTDDGILEHKCAINAVKELSKHKQELLTKEKALKNSPFVEQKPWSEEDENNLYYWLDNNKSIGNDKYRWLLSLKDRVQPQPKQEWSEEDKKIIDRIESEFLALHRGDYKNIDFNNVDNLSVLNWVRKIKFLCFLSHWKPSDEQMNTLEYYMHTLVCNEHKEILFGLYSCLKKLREE